MESAHLVIHHVKISDSITVNLFTYFTIPYMARGHVNMIKRLARWILREELNQLKMELELSVPSGTILAMDGRIIGMLADDGHVIPPVFEGVGGTYQPNNTHKLSYDYDFKTMCEICKKVTRHALIGLSESKCLECD